MTLTITTPITTCEICGERDWRHVKVLGARGIYCRPCSTVAMIEAARFSRKFRSDNLRRGIVVIPSPDWEPSEAIRTLFGGVSRMLRHNCENAPEATGRVGK